MTIISLGISLISIGIAIYAIRLSRKTYRLQSARPHSEKLLGQEISPLQENLSKFILHPFDFPEEKFNLPKIQTPHHFYQHLQSGYKEIFQKYNIWLESVKKHNKLLEKFNMETYDKIQKEIGLPSFSPYIAPPYVYYQRLICYIFKEIILREFGTRKMPELPALPEPNLKIHPYELLESIEKYFCELRWNDTGIVIGTKKEICEKAKDFILNLYSEHTIKEKIQEFYHNAESLLLQCGQLQNEINTNITDKLKIGGIIKGKCDACC